jgi:hypothetical protein
MDGQGVGRRRLTVRQGDTRGRRRQRATAFDSGRWAPLTDNVLEGVLQLEGEERVRWDRGGRTKGIGAHRERGSRQLRLRLQRRQQLEWTEGHRSVMGVRCELLEEEIMRGGRKGSDGGARPL